MRLPRGFGKKGYFTLASIQAATSENKVQRHVARLRHTTCLLFENDTDTSSLEDDPPSLLLALFNSLVSYRPRVCRCNRLFASRAHCAIKRAQKRRKCNCNCRYFSFRRTGVHPPSSLYLLTSVLPTMPANFSEEH